VEDGNGSRNMGYTTRVDAETVEADSDLRTVVLDQKVSVTPLSYDMTSRVDFGELRQLLGE
jgi:broad specificity polyphosphatase/5'/3'-nucleotidase SurE